MEGTIGAGKSTFLSQFQGSSHVTFIHEDLERWQSVPGLSGDGKNLLAKFYADPPRWAHTFEAYVLLTKAEGHQLVVPTPIKLMERSVHSGALVFSELLRDQGVMSELEHALCMEHFRHHLEGGKCDVDLWIYLRTPACVAFERIQRRGREEEVGVITMAYMEALERQYDQFYDNLDGPKIKIDGSASVEEVFARTKEQLFAVLPAELSEALYA
jgi:deoxyadenosine/deoxycytidine kinase